MHAWVASRPLPIEDHSTWFSGEKGGRKSVWKSVRCKGSFVERERNGTEKMMGKRPPSKKNRAATEFSEKFDGGGAETALKMSWENAIPVTASPFLLPLVIRIVRRRRRRRRRAAPDGREKRGCNKSIPLLPPPFTEGGGRKGSLSVAGRPSDRRCIQHLPHENEQRSTCIWDPLPPPHNGISQLSKLKGRIFMKKASKLKYSRK